MSYDVTRRKRSIAVRVAEFVYGRKVRVSTKQRVKTYRNEGLIMRAGVERIGQAVVIMKENDFEDFHRYLTELRVPHMRLHVWTDF